MRLEQSILACEQAMKKYMEQLKAGKSPTLVFQGSDEQLALWILLASQAKPAINADKLQILSNDDKSRNIPLSVDKTIASNKQLSNYLDANNINKAEVLTYASTIPVSKELPEKNYVQITSDNKVNQNANGKVELVYTPPIQATTKRDPRDFTDTNKYKELLKKERDEVISPDILKEAKVDLNNVKVYQDKKTNQNIVVFQTEEDLIAAAKVAQDKGQIVKLGDCEFSEGVRETIEARNEQIRLNEAQQKRS